MTDYRDRVPMPASFRELVAWHRTNEASTRPGDPPGPPGATQPTRPGNHPNHTPAASQRAAQPHTPEDPR